MQARNIAILLAIIVLLYVIELIRRQKMTFKYSFMWFASTALVLLFAVNDQWLAKLSTLAGFELPSNFVFFLLLLFFVALSLSLTVYINEQNERSEKLAQAIGILDYKLNELREKAAKKQG